MAELITMPRLSDTMEDGTVTKWHKNVGDSVSEGDILAEIETDKAVQEFESEYDGVLLYRGVEEGHSVAVESPLAVIGQAEEAYAHLLTNFAEPSHEAEEPFIEIANNKDSDILHEIPQGVALVTMPRLSDTMEEGTVTKWHKNVGDPVSEGDLLAEIETDKAVQEFESEYDGFLLYQGVAEGQAVPVERTLAIIGPSETNVTALIKNTADKTSVASVDVEESTAVSEVIVTNDQPLSDVSNQKILASPLAKKIAQEKQIDLTKVKGSGENGRITKADVENHTVSEVIIPSASKIIEKDPSKSVEKAKKPVAIQSMAIVEEDTDVEVSQMRKVIAKRLSESKFTAPHYYLTMDINMSQAIHSRQVINELPDTKISFNDLVIKACAAAIKQHPKVNTSWSESKITIHGNANIGVAVAIEDGLVVPVINNTDRLSLKQISAAVKDLATRARERKLTAEEMSGSTFTISNLGMFGIESFTSIINAPNACILSVGAIIEKPIVKEGQLAIGQMMKLTLACDHRVVDGATGSTFLQTLKAMLENPVTILA